MKLTKDDILRVNHHRAIGFDEFKSAVQGVSTDSRKVSAADMFFAVRGERHDGHNFVSTAVQAGAAVVVVDRHWAEANEAMVISIHVPRLIVENTVHALGELARIHRKKFRIPILAVGGSNGKTTTKEMIRSVLKQKFNVLATEGNLNNHIGVPQTLFRLEQRHKAAVVEIGTNHFGEINYLCEILEPTHGIITNVGHEHLEFFGSLRGVAKAEGELFDWLRLKKGVAFVNKDDGHISKMSRGLKTERFGFSPAGVKVRGTFKGFNERGCAQLRIKQQGKKPFDISLSVPGEHNARNTLAAATVGLFFKVPVPKIQKALASFTAAHNRMEMLFVAGVTILNDSYNSNPDSVIAALSTVSAMNASGKRIAVLSDMLELGNEAPDQHRHVGRMVSRNDIEYLLTFGPLSKFTNDAAHVKFKAHYDQKNMLCEYLAELVTAGDVVLIKGSRGMKMEEVVEFLKNRLQSNQGGGERAA
ncbi:MAG: UDP-N-acetylmuramoyl-tripeptide--D-alanyl-D-alanine ligase [Ignavibacteriales bacterium]|nr:UDP-N-acetylmuramoyl-tripeptide--D-alanyl-D-alanine ligase [Ignavibacteriales bacterium]